MLLAAAFVYEGTASEGEKVAQKEELGAYAASGFATLLAGIVTTVATLTDLPPGALLVPSFVAVDFLRCACIRAATPALLCNGLGESSCTNYTVLYIDILIIHRSYAARTMQFRSRWRLSLAQLAP